MLFRDKLVILILSVVPRPQKLVISMKMKHNLNYQLPISDTEYGATPVSYTHLVRCKKF